MNTVPFFDRPVYFLSAEQYQETKDGQFGEHFLALAKESSPLFHYSWRDDLVEAKGKDYQHFRPLKDDVVAQQIRALYDSGNFSLAEAGRILNPACEEELVSPDGKELFSFGDDGSVKFDLIRVDFDHLTQKWQDANLDAALFALCLVQKCISTGVTINFENFERMSSDIHEFWAANNNYPGQSAKLMTIYKNLPVDALRNNQKDKDRVHIGHTVDSLSLPLTEASKNRQIVLNAMNALFRDQQQNGTLDPSFGEQLDALQAEIDQRNIEDFTKYKQLSAQTKEQVLTILQGKGEVDLETFEAMSAAFHEQWRSIYGEEQNENIVADYDQLPVNDPLFNQKQFSRECVQTFLGEMVSDGLIPSSVMDSVGALTPQIEALNQQDFVKYQATAQAEVPEE
ncbi:MAG: hypothetical protein IJW32_02925 [Clostridia bacterium]|nr:hypothetical protein [Clostridia bacterium]